jgi:hypothetical protein
MKKNKIGIALVMAAILVSCASQRDNVITGGEYNEVKNQTDYFVLPYGSAVLPGKWVKTRQSNVSFQQFFKNKDSVTVAIAFSRCNQYPFNTKGTKTGFEFVKAYYEWDSNYFIEKYGLKRSVVEMDSIENNYCLYRIYGAIENEKIDNYFLLGEKNGFVSNFCVLVTDKWAESYKIDFLKKLFLTKN